MASYLTEKMAWRWSDTVLVRNDLRSDARGYASWFVNVRSIFCPVITPGNDNFVGQTVKATLTVCPQGGGVM
ncbi:hypothetical protein [Paraburkholderia nodosa]|uniref:hypothetical protein n=1 Tax=Paraburkholderia nodosa TaxID=392320 RepID=UPI0012B6936C|nr:hypothetical protein [Paraburkholderia nodosa]